MAVEIWNETWRLAESASKKLGLDRQRFLARTAGMATAFIAMNEVFGRFFHVDPIEMFEPVAYAQPVTARGLRTRGTVGVPEAAFSKGYMTDLRQAYECRSAQQAYIDRAILIGSLGRFGLSPL